MNEHRSIDVQVKNEGTIFAFRPLTTAGLHWIRTKVHAEPHQWLGPILCVDHRYARGIMAAMRHDHLKLEMLL